MQPEWDVCLEHHTDIYQKRTQYSIGGMQSFLAVLLDSFHAGPIKEQSFATNAGRVGAERRIETR